MKENAYTPAYHIPRISETRRYPFAHLHGIEEMLNTEVEWLNADRQSHRLFDFYHDTDLAFAMYKSVCRDLEYINADLAIYSYIVEGWF